MTSLFTFIFQLENIQKELNIIYEYISLYYFQIVEKWKAIHSGNK